MKYVENQFFISKNEATKKPDGLSSFSFINKWNRSLINLGFSCLTLLRIFIYCDILK